MILLEFNFNGIVTSIQCEKTEKMKEIFQKFAEKVKIDLNSVFFLYNGMKLEKELILNECINVQDEEIKNMKIIVYQLNIDEENNKNKNIIIKSKDIICPKCKEICKIKLSNYKITLIQCKNNHIHPNIFLKDYKKTQIINQNEIICSNYKCLKKKSKTYNNEFFICNTCDVNLCPLCINYHRKGHNIIKYNEKNYICKLHSKSFTSYCKKCNINLCNSCEEKHKEHNKICLRQNLPDINNFKIKNNELKYSLDLLKENINEIINKFKEIISNLEIYYEINNELIDNCKKENINYEILWNFNEFINNNDVIINDIISIDGEKNLKEKINKLLDIYNKMKIKDNEIEMIYKIKENETTVKIFGDSFVQNNKDICKIICENKIYDLTKDFELAKLEQKTDLLRINLFNINNVTNMSEIFDCCESLISLPDISNWKTYKIIDMSFCFRFCSSLSTLTDISEWDTSNVTHMCGMFFGCESLTSIPDISNWNTSNVTDMSFMFSGCPLLNYLPDISKWNTSNLQKISYMFGFEGYNIKTKSLKSLPDISIWNTNKLIEINSLFATCELLSSIPDISKWNISKVKNLSCLFYGCTSLKSLPDLSKWNMSKVNNLKEMFKGCKSLTDLPDISKWNMSNVTDINSMFMDCSSLKSLPNISNWDTGNIINMSDLFKGCTSLTNLPDISSWDLSNIKI